MFKKSDLETITISILTKNPNTFFNQSALFNQLINLFTTEELFVGHYLFVWEKLLMNTNFIEKQIQENEVLIKLRDFNNGNSQVKTHIFEPLSVDINQLIKHMIKYPELYNGPNIINTFLLKINNYSEKYNSVYDILSDTKLIKDPNDSINFINLYYKNINALVTNPVHKHILLEKYNETQEIIEWYTFQNNKIKRNANILWFFILLDFFLKIKGIWFFRKSGLVTYFYKFSLKK